MDLDLQNVTWDPVLLSLAAFLAVCAIYLLFLRNAVMWGFLCILGIVGLFVIMVSPDMLEPPLGQPAAPLARSRSARIASSRRSSGTNRWSWK